MEGVLSDMTILVFVLGILIGCLLTRYLLYRNNTVGSLKLEDNNPDSSPYMFLEIYQGKSHLLNSNRYVVVKIEYSQK